MVLCPGLLTPGLINKAALHFEMNPLWLRNASLEDAAVLARRVLGHVLMCNNTSSVG